MAKIDELTNAKRNKKDEFYTQYEVIQEEINAYLEYNPDTFRDKTVLLPCDDPEWSNFTRFFAQNFETLGLKKLISTSYAPNSNRNKYHQISLFEIFDEFNQPLKEDEPRGRIFTLTRRNKKVDIDDLSWKYLDGDGDFRSDEVKTLRDEADIIVTNPPFSLFKDFFNWVLEANKQFLIIGSQMAITYSEVFPQIQANNVWLGPSIHSGDREFRVPDDYPLKAAGHRIDKHGNKYIRVKGVRWFTNIDHGRRHIPMSLMTMADNVKFSKHKEIQKTGYFKYDNYDVLEVPFTDAIPSDYDDLMGVPITFMDKYNPEQFEIVGSSQTGCHPDSMVLRSYKDYKGYHQDGKPTGRTGSTCGHNPMILKNDGVHDYYMNDEGRIVQSGNSRIFIRRKDA